MLIFLTHILIQRFLKNNKSIIKKNKIKGKSEIFFQANFYDLTTANKTIITILARKLKVSILYAVY